jgi:hypothetical protein
MRNPGDMVCVTVDAGGFFTTVPAMLLTHKPAITNISAEGWMVMVEWGRETPEVFVPNFRIGDSVPNA